MKRVYLESPYASKDGPEGVKRNVRYARACMRHCLTLGEAPFASHLLYTQVLDDLLPAERSRGIDAGLVWGLVAEKTVVYVDLGLSGGMRLGIEAAIGAERPIDVRGLHRTPEALEHARETMRFMREAAARLGKQISAPPEPLAV